MGERGCRSRVGKVVSRNIDCLHRRNRTGLGRGNTLLKFAHFRCQRGLVTYCRRHTAEQCGHLRTCLGETEDVVDEQQNVLTLITEVFRFGKASKTNAKTCSRRLVHLAIDQAGLVDNARIAHLEEQVGSLTGTLAYTGEYRSTTMLLSEVVDEFLNDNGLTNTSAAEQTRLATLDEGLDQVDRLDAGLKDLGSSGELVISRCRTMDRHPLFDVGHGLAVNWLAYHIPNTTQGLRTNRHHHGSACILNFKAAR